MGITRFQDFLFEINDLPERQLTEEELAPPCTRSIRPADGSHRIIASLYLCALFDADTNTGSQNHGPARRQSWPHVIENGERIRRPYAAPYVT